MGRFNEDVFYCRNCRETIVYEPANEEIVKCDNCGMVHKIRDREIHAMKSDDLQQKLRELNQRIGAILADNRRLVEGSKFRNYNTAELFVNVHILTGNFPQLTKDETKGLRLMLEELAERLREEERR